MVVRLAIAFAMLGCSPPSASPPPQQARFAHAAAPLVHAGRVLDRPHGRAYGAAAAVRNLVVVAGGTDYRRKRLTDVDVLDTATMIWHVGAPLPTPRDFPAAGALEDKVYVIGGLLDRDPNATPVVEAYDATTDSWTTRAPLNVARSRAAAAVLDGRLYVFGGLPVGDKTAAVQAPVEQYDVATDRWTVVVDMPAPLHAHTATTVGDAIMLVGGYASGPQPTIWIFRDGRFAKEPHALTTARGFHGTALLGNELVVFGGRTGTPAATERFDLGKRNRWRAEAADTALDRQRFQFASVGDRVYVIGGEPQAAAIEPLVVARDPVSGRWQ